MVVHDREKGRLAETREDKIMPSTEITVTTRRPPPPKADFAFHVNFKKGEGPASRVFAATHAFIEACEHFDSELASSIDANIETVLILEDIETGSLQTWFRTLLSSVDDQALKQLDWKQAVGNYLVKAKYMMLRWIDNDTDPRDLNFLANEIQELAKNSDVRHIGDYPPVKPEALVNAIKEFENVKGHLVEGDEASMILPDEEPAHFDLSIRLDVEGIEALAVRETQTHMVPSMVLVVKRPDYLGSSMWDFRHGKKSLSASMEDVEWLQEFQARNVDIKPGDALRCSVRMEISYGHDNEVVKERHYVETVHEVLENQYRQPLLFNMNGNDGPRRR